MNDFKASMARKEPLANLLQDLVVTTIIAGGEVETVRIYRLVGFVCLVCILTAKNASI